MVVKWSFDVLLAAARDLRQNLWPLARLDLYLTLLALIVFTPAAGWLADILVSRSGRMKFANDQADRRRHRSIAVPFSGYTRTRLAMRRVAP
jgi:hypothetical protein